MRSLRDISEPFLENPILKFKNKRKYMPKWFDVNCRRVKVKCRTALAGYRKTGNKYALHRFRSAKSLYRCTTQTAKRQWLKRSKEELEEAVRNKDISKIWRAVKSTRGRYSGPDSSILPSKWIEHFNITMNHATPDRDEWCQNYENVSVECLDTPITPDEVLWSIKRIKSGSPGKDGISGNALKWVAVLLAPFLTKWYNVIYDSGIVPAAWTSATLVPLHKSGSFKDPSNYRGIALLSHLGKVFMRIMKQRMSKWVQAGNLINDAQGGFMKKRSTVDNALVLDTLIRQARRKKRGKLFVASIDLKKAFDFVPRKAILDRLMARGVSTKMCKIVESMFKRSSFMVKLSSSEATQQVPSSSGIFQGCVFSPQLFVFFLDTLNDSFQNINSESPNLMHRIIRHLLWADDLILISKTTKGLQILLDKFEDFCAYWGLTVNTSKSHVIVFKGGTRRAKEESWFYQGQPLDVCRVSRYLGIFFSYNSSWIPHLKKMEEKANIAVRPLLSFYYRNKTLPFCFFQNLYATLIEPILLYGAELWAPHISSHKFSTINKSLNKHSSRFLKRLLGLPRNAATSATFMETASTSVFSKALLRAIYYWLKIKTFPNDHIMQLCLREQEDLMANGDKPWLFGIKNILDHLGYTNVWENHGPTNIRNFKYAVRERIKNINITEFQEEAKTLRSLKYYSERKTHVSEPESYLKFNPQIRRIIAHLRLNLKYSLPWLPHSTFCKMCNAEGVLDPWEHFLDKCEALPPLPPDHESIPYPHCIPILMKNFNHPYIRRLKFIL